MTTLLHDEYEPSVEVIQAILEFRNDFIDAIWEVKFPVMPHIAYSLPTASVIVAAV
jgi:uncharacterized protein (UPF0216 family)